MSRRKKRARPPFKGWKQVGVDEAGGPLWQVPEGTKIKREPPPPGPPPEDPDAIALEVMSDPHFAGVSAHLRAIGLAAARMEYAAYHNPREALDAAMVAVWKAGGPRPPWLPGRGSAK